MTLAMTLYNGGMPGDLSRSDGLVGWWILGDEMMADILGQSSVIAAPGPEIEVVPYRRTRWDRILEEDHELD